MSYRKIHDTFWTDPDLEEFTPEQKFFYIYLITNPRVNQIGLYEFSIKHAALETGYNTDTVSKLLEFFEDKGKIVRSKKTKELVVCKFWHHNKSTSPKVLIHVEGLLKCIKDTVLIQYIYGMDTETQEEEEKEKEINKKKFYDDVIDSFNSITGKKVRITDSRKKQINGRIREGYGLDDFKKVIQTMNGKWKGTDMEQYLTPDTLFRESKFTKYLEMSQNGTQKIISNI